MIETFRTLGVLDKLAGGGRPGRDMERYAADQFHTFRTPVDDPFELIIVFIFNLSVIEDSIFEEEIGPGRRWQVPAEPPPGEPASGPRQGEDPAPHGVSPSASASPSPTDAEILEDRAQAEALEEVTVSYSDEAWRWGEEDGDDPDSSSCPREYAGVPFREILAEADARAVETSAADAAGAGVCDAGFLPRDVPATARSAGPAGGSPRAGRWTPRCLIWWWPRSRRR